MQIPFNRPYITGKEIEYIQDTFSKRKLSGDGYYTKKASRFIEETFSVQKALLVTSCTSALDMSAMLLGIQPGDEVILPSYTFVSTANAFVLRGALPVFADIQEDTLNISPQEIEKKITPKTKAIYLVHYAGVSCDMDKIMEISQKHNIPVVEDAAQGVNAKYKNRFLGSIGNIGCYSFHETKNYSCGEGGAILINQESLIERAEILREKGTNRSKFFRGEIDKYTWVDIGSSYLISEILAAHLFAQFEQLEKIQELRKNIFYRYYNALQEYERKGKLRLPFLPSYSSSNYHIFYILLETQEIRDHIMDKLKASGILAVFHYIPLHISTMGKKFGYKEGDFPITEKCSKTLLRLPLYADFTSQEQDYTIEMLYKILE
ncbi:MAG: dTDP-4-amino-4,6-dideoxygalactose transaminase [Candidatus Brocadiae bacterium]|nr:dTDP-4-amino-4,6-dideoxygalactose transaminase [Candidatus Brocadiia bacterium]